MKARTETKVKICGRLGRAVRIFSEGMTKRLKCGRPMGHSGPHECYCGCGRKWWKMETKRKTSSKKPASKGAEWNLGV